MLNPKSFAEWLEKQAADKCGYIMCAVGQDPKKLNDWYFNQYQSDKSAYAKAIYWKEHAPRVFDCQGLADCYVTENAGAGYVNVRARNNYADWCGIKGEGKIPDERKTEGAAVFRMGAKYIEHVGFLARPVDAGNRAGDWIVVEARGVHYGVVETKLSARNWNRWGWMTKYFDYAEQPDTVKEYGGRNLKRGMSGADVKALQSDLIALGYSCGSYGADGEFGRATVSALKAFQADNGLTADGIAGKNTYAMLDKRLPEDGDMKDQAQPEKTVTVVNGVSWNIRIQPGVTGAKLGIAHNGDTFAPGSMTADGWVNIIYNGLSAWISNKAVEA